MSRFPRFVVAALTVPALAVGLAFSANGVETDGVETAMPIYCC